MKTHSLFLYALLIVLTGCHSSQDETVYDYCQIKSFTSSNYKGFYENGKIIRLETGTGDDLRITYFDYENNLLLSTHTVNKAGDIIDSKRLSYYPNGKWKMILYQSGYRDSAVYSPDEFKIYSRSFSVLGADTTFNSIYPGDSISYKYQNGNLQSFAHFRSAVGDTLISSFEYNADVTPIDFFNMNLGYERLPRNRNYNIKETESSTSETEQHSSNIEYRFNASGWPVMIKNGAGEARIEYECY